MSFEDVADGRIIRLAGLPDFNNTDSAFKITGFDGLFATPPLDAQYSASGGGPGAIASGQWLSKERPMVLQGFINADLSLLPGYARALAAALPATTEGTIQIFGNGRDIDLKIFVRRYDKADMPISSRLDFTIPLLALDPYLYGNVPLSGGVSVDAGTFWYESYSKPSSTWVKTYVKSGSSWFGTFSNAQPPGPYSKALSLTPAPGGVSSRRLTFTVFGPLGVSDWQLSQVGSSREMWVQVAIPSGQSVTIDTYNETATMNGEDISNLLYGDMLTLEPGGSTYTLTSSTPSPLPYALVSALPAYEI